MLLTPKGFRGYRVHPNYLLAKVESAHYNRVIRTSVSDASRAACRPCSARFSSKFLGGFTLKNTRLFVGSCLMAMASLALAQDQPAPAPAAPTPLPTPAITGPLAGLPPATFDAGPFGKIAVNGFLTGWGLLQNNHVPGDDTARADLSNGQIVIQKTDGVFQFYLQAGTYALPDLGAPFIKTKDIVSNTYGPLPVAFAKLQAGKNTSFLIGSLPTLIGAEYTFSFQNLNIERGLLWNTEPLVSKGVQVNFASGP